MHSMYNMAVFELKHSENWVQFASLSSGGRDSNFHSTITCMQCSGTLYMCMCICVMYVKFSPYNYTCEYKSR
jgi:hypothetical protein